MKKRPEPQPSGSTVVAMSLGCPVLGPLGYSRFGHSAPEEEKKIKKGKKPFCAIFEILGYLLCFNFDSLETLYEPFLTCF